MATKKIKKDFWEQLFIHPSFNIRFWFTLVFVLVIFSIIVAIILFGLNLVDNLSDKIATVNVVVQLATLVLGVFAAYYALRQLVETRFTGLEEAGMQELKRNHYSRAFEKWREAFYIRPEAMVFANMCEALLLVGDYDTFDRYIGKSQVTGLLKKEIFHESSDYITMLYLRAVRHLLVKNQGEAEKHIKNLVDLVKKEGLLGFHWDFIDLQGSPVYQDFSGECLDIADNLISYLRKTIPPTRKKDFESGNYASQVKESSGEIKIQS